MKEKDWFDEHMEVIGENPRQSKMLKNKIKEGLTEEFEKDWRKKVVGMKKDYEEKILNILQETGYQDVISLIEGLQKQIKTMKKTIEEK